MVSCDMPCDGQGCFGLQSSLIIACADYFWMDDLGANLSLPLTRPRQTLQSLIFLMGHPGCLWIKLLSAWNQCLGLSVSLTVPLSQKKRFSFVKISHLSLLSWFRLVFITELCWPLICLGCWLCSRYLVIKDFPFFCTVPFHLFDGFPYCRETFSFNQFHLLIFAFVATALIF